MRSKIFASAFFAGAAALGGAQTAVAGGADLGLLPGTGSVLLHVDMARLRGSAFYKEVIAPALQNPAFQQEMNEAKNDLGFDPVNDINSLTVLMNPPGGGTKEEALIIVDGNVNRDKLIGMAQKEGKATKATHNGSEMWVSPPGEEDMALAFLKDKTVIGKQAMVKGAIDAQGKGALNAQLKGLVDSVNKGGDVWFVANVPEAARAEMAKGGNPLAKDMKTVTGSVDFAKGLALNLSVASTAEGAKAMADMIQQSLKLDPQSEPMMQQMGLLPIIQKLKVEAKGADLNIGLDLDSNDVNKLKMLAGMLSMGMMGGGGAPPMAPVPPGPGPVKQQ